MRVPLLPSALQPRLMAVLAPIPKEGIPGLRERARRPRKGDEVRLLRLNALLVGGDPGDRGVDDAGCCCCPLGDPIKGVLILRRSS